MRNAGFAIEIIDEADMPSVKSRLRVPRHLVSCHTAEIGDYVLEGHVPATAVRKLLEERPAAIGLAVAAMPLGSPGMEGMGDDEPFDVVLFDTAGQRSFARFQGDKQM
jgi:hypothetical protein